MIFRLFLSLSILGLWASLHAKSGSSVLNELADEVSIVIEQIINIDEEHKKTEKKILLLNDKINKNQIVLDDMIEKKNILENDFANLLQRQKDIETSILSLTLKKYSKSIAIKYTNKKSSKSIIDNEVHRILRNSIKKEVLLYEENSILLKDKIALKLNLITELNDFKYKQKQLISSHRTLKRKQENSIKELRKKHEYYVTKLEEMNKIGTQGTENRIKSFKDTDIQKIISKGRNKAKLIYEKMNAIAPLSKYTITSKFGEYYDEAFHSELFNKSISLKPKKSKMIVQSMLKGKVLVIKKDTDYSKNIVVVQHSNNLHIIYANIDTLSSNIFIGKEVSKGTRLGHVTDHLILEVTHNNKYINPEKLFK